MIKCKKSNFQNFDAVTEIEPNTMLEWSEKLPKRDFLYNILRALYILFAKIPSNNAGYEAVKYDFLSILDAARNLALHDLFNDPHELFNQTNDFYQKFGIPKV